MVMAAIAITADFRSGAFTMATMSFSPVVQLILMPLEVSLLA